MYPMEDDMSKASQLPETLVYAHGTERYWIEDNTIAVVVFGGDMSQQGIDESNNVLLDVISEAPDPRNVYIVYHLEKFTALTPKARKVATHFFAELPANVRVHMAMILRNSLLHNLITMFLAGIRRLINDRLQYRVFHDEASAIEWLKAERAARASQ
jgi:hypothetical protein